MTAYAYSEWNAKSSEAKTKEPGVSIPRSHPVNNPNRGVYWSGQSSALALATSIQEGLTDENGENAQKLFRQLRQLYRDASENDNAIKRATTARQMDADRVLSASGYAMNEAESEQMQSTIDDVSRIQDQAEVAGVDPVGVARIMLNRAAAAAVGFAPSTQAMPEYAAYLDTEEGRVSQDNLSQSVRQLYSMIRTGEYDALNPEIDPMTPEGSTMSEEMDSVRGLLNSIPLERRTTAVEPSQYFSVRMDTKEEAQTMEQILKWVGKHEELPSHENVHEAFNALRDNAVVASPYSPRRNMRLGLIVGQSQTATEAAADVISHAQDAQVIVLTSENDAFKGEEFAGRPVFHTSATANLDGVGIKGINNAPANAVVVMNLSREEAQDPYKRSVAANAFVGSSLSVAHLAGNALPPHEAQAVRMASNHRKLTFAIDKNGNEVTDRAYTNAKGVKVEEPRLSQLRDMARTIDMNDDFGRYLAARSGDTLRVENKRGHETYAGMTVAFDGARNYDAAIRRFGHGRDPMGDVYSRIPRHAMILTTNIDKMAAYKFLSAQNAKERQENSRQARPVFYAEAQRKLSFAQDIEAGLESQKVISREARTEMTIYDKPRNERKNAADGIVEWGDRRLYGAIILVSGNAQDDARNVGAQATKVAQEAIVDFSHTGVIFDDMQKDIHAAHLTKLSMEMGKRFTVMNKEGNVVPLGMARNTTRHMAQSYTELTEAQLKDRMHGNREGLDVEQNNLRRNAAYGLGHPVGQMTLSGLPGMSDAKAAGLKDLPFTLEDIFKTQDPEVKKALYDAGMPSDTIKALDNTQAWMKSLDAAIMNEAEGETWEMQYKGPGSSALLPANRAGFVMGKQTIDKPVVAMIGNALPTYDGATRKATTPDELIDREQLSKSIQAMTAKGFAIATTFEEGVGLAVIEEASKVKGAELIVAAPSNPFAGSPEMRVALGKMLEKESATVVTHTGIAPHRFETANGPQTRYAELRSAMHDTVAAVSDMALVVQASSNDQSLHMVDKMNAQNKPVAVMIPDDVSLASAEAYRGNLKLARGGGRARIESISMATVPTPQGYAAINDEDTEVKLIDGVLRGNAGTFQSARIARTEMARGGHHYKPIGWGQAAQVVTSQASVEKLATAYRRGELEPLGAFKEPTQREIETRSLARTEVSREASHEFAEQQKMHNHLVMQDAARSAGY